MNKLFLITLLFSMTPTITWAQTIPNYEERTLETSLPWFIGSRSFGEMRVRIKAEKLIEINTRDYIKIRESIFKPHIIANQKVSDSEEWIKVKDLDFKISYDPIELIILTEIAEDQLRPEVYSLELSDKEKFQSVALERSPFGGAINFQVEKSFGDDYLGGNTFSTYFDSFVNMNGVVLENRTNYHENTRGEKTWFRGDTRLVKDFAKHRIRAQVGDIYPRGLGFMAPRPLGGVMVSKDFTLNPYKTAYPRSGGEFTLQTRSHVKTIVNGMVIKDEYLPAGNYNLNDLPLVNGINQVQVEVTDELGGKQIYDFTLPTSISMLAKGEWDFAVSSGKPFQDTRNKRKYSNDLSTQIIGQYGINDHFSIGGYAQFEDDFWITGAEAGMSSLIGNFFTGIASSGDDTNNGTAGSLTWQWQNLGRSLFSSFTFTAKHEVYSQGFKRYSVIPIDGLKSSTMANVTLPLQNLMTVSLGTSFSPYRDSSFSDKRTYDLTLNLKAHRRVNLSFYFAETQDQYRAKYNVAYAYLTWTFDGSNNFLNAFRDIENQSTRINYIKDNNNELYSPRINTAFEESKQSHGVDIEGNIPTPFANFMARGEGAKMRAGEKDYYGRGTLGINSAFVFAYKDGEFGVGLSRPVNNSFVLFKTSEELENENIGLRSSSSYIEGQTGLMGEITYGNLLPYQYREIQLDPSHLSEGLSLEREKFVIYPEYKSAHKIVLGGRGSVTLTGIIVDKFGKPQNLKVGKINETVFFTDRQGRFYVESLSQGRHKLMLDGYESVLEIEVLKSERGLKNIGLIQLD